MGRNIPVNERGDASNQEEGLRALQKLLNMGLNSDEAEWVVKFIQHCRASGVSLNSFNTGRILVQIRRSRATGNMETVIIKESHRRVLAMIDLDTQ